MERLPPSAGAELVSDVPARALAIYAHPDDPDVSCGGTLALWARAGAEVRVVICARGDKGSVDASVDPVGLVARRAEEVASAAAVLGLAGTEILAHPDGELADTPGLRAELVAVIRRLQPEAVVCPDPEAVFFGQDYFNHPDHRAVGWATLDAAAHGSAMPLYYPEAGAAHQVALVFLSGSLQPDVWVDVSTTLDLKAEALACHRSQIGEFGVAARTLVRERAENEGRRSGVRYAESFRCLRLAH